MFSQGRAFSFLVAAIMMLSVASPVRAANTVKAKDRVKATVSAKKMALTRPIAIFSFWKFCKKNPRAKRIYLAELSKDFKNKGAVWGNRMINLFSGAGLYQGSKMLIQHGPDGLFNMAQQYVATAIPDVTALATKGGGTVLGLGLATGLAGKVYKRYRRAREATLKQMVQEGYGAEIPAGAFGSISQEGRDLMIERLITELKPDNAATFFPKALLDRINIRTLSPAARGALSAAE